MSQIFGVIVLTLVLVRSVSAQDIPLEPLKVSSNVSFGYNASILYPGLRGGIEYPINRIYLTKYRGRRPDRHYSKFRYLSAELGYYHHPTFHDNIYFLTGWRTRRHHPNRYFKEFSSGMGFSRTILGSETYTVDPNGNISLVKCSGYNYLLFAVGGGFGYTLPSKISAFMRNSILLMIPSNNLVYLRPTIELGLNWRPVNFLKATIRNVSKLKGHKT